MDLLCNCETFFYKCSCVHSNYLRFVEFGVNEVPATCRDVLQNWDNGKQKEAKNTLLKSLVGDSEMALCNIPKMDPETDPSSYNGSGN